MFRSLLGLPILVNAKHAVYLQLAISSTVTEILLDGKSEFPKIYRWVALN